MSKKIQISELLNTKTAEKYQPELTAYFEKGGTWQELLGFEKNTMAAQYQAAYSLYQSADFKKAADAFSYLTMLNPYEYVYWMGLGASKQSDRAFEEATVAYTIAEAIAPEHPTPHLHLAQCFYALQQKDKMMEHLQKAASLSSQKDEFKEIHIKAKALIKNMPL